MLNVAPQKERIPDHLRAMAEQDDKSAASGKTGEQSSIGVGCAPGEERDSAISICAVHSTTVTAAIAEFCEDTVEKQKALTEVLDGLVDLTTRLASLANTAPAKKRGVLCGCSPRFSVFSCPPSLFTAVAHVVHAVYPAICCASMDTQSG